jgi:glycosyltransferase involved in cell wall biosynthesis
MSPKIVIVHPGFPGQFGHIAQEWSKRPGWDVRIITANGRILANDPIERRLENHGWSWDNIYGYDYQPEKIRFGENKEMWQLEINLLHSKGTASVLQDFKEEGWIPDVILAHPGWLSTMRAKDILPDTTLVHFCEHMELWQPPKPGVERGSIGFDADFPPKDTDFYKIHLDYLQRLHMLNLCDQGVSPLTWQKQLHPKEYWSKIDVIHEGVDTGSYEPFDITDVPPGTPVVSFTARSLEPSRGFHRFMQAAAMVLNSNPDVHFFITGSERATYDTIHLEDFDSWKDFCLHALGKDFDRSRIHFFGKVDHHAHMRLLQHSSVHVHFNHPGVLSWSCLEAMGQGKLVVGSRTGPVKEVIKNGVNGVLFDYHDEQGLAQILVDVLAEPNDYRAMAEKGRQTVLNKYTRELGLQAWDKFIFGIMSRRANGLVLS